jgi:hypothetical protein
MDTTLAPINNSQVKRWRECRKAWSYKYPQQLVPKHKRLPLYKGSWVHACLETHYKQGDWKIGYNEYLEEYNKLFEEEQAALNTRGHLPTVVKRIIQSYVWYTRKDNWKVVMVEQTFDFVFHGIRIKGTIDLVVEDEDGHRWLIDHKTATSIPPASAFHAMDPQLQLYPWAADQAWDFRIDGILWNYVKSKAPSIPKMTRAGAISRSKIVTDYPTMYRFLKENGYDPQNYTQILRPLAKESPFLRRYKLPRGGVATDTILSEFMVTAQEIYDQPPIIRTIGRHCVMCDYLKLCQAELNGFDTTNLRRSDYEIEDVTIKHGNYDPAEFEDLDEI